jgi:CBS-domain-containing membrane protein
MHEMFDRIVSLRVCDVMTASPVTVDSSCSMAEVSSLFASRGLHSAPVVDDAGRCVGVITASDFVKRSEVLAQSDQQPHTLCHGEEGILLEPKSYDYVTDCMSPCVQAVAPITPLIRAAKIMTSAHLHTIPVIEDHKPVGILSTLDVVAALVNAFEEAKNSI